jgi:hypothetical protein
MHALNFSKSPSIRSVASLGGLPFTGSFHLPFMPLLYIFTRISPKINLVLAVFCFEKPSFQGYPEITMSAPDTKFVLQLAQAIEDAKANLTQLQAKWEALFSGPSIAEPLQPTERKGGRKPSPDGIASRTLQVIESDRDIEFDADLISTRLGVARKQIDKALANLYAAQKIERPSRGRYKAKVLPPEQQQSALGLVVN